MTLQLGPDDKQMRLRYAGVCRLCRRSLAAGDTAIYERTSKTVRCIACAGVGAVRAAGVQSQDSAAVDSGSAAGASARHEYERRRNNREQRIRHEHPKLGGLILALSDDPQSTRAWERGAIGEELMAQRLTDLPDTFRVLHDRRIPRTRANIDHLVIGPTGVWVIDAKRYVAKRPALRIDGGLVRSRVETLRIGGRDGTKLVQGVQSQVSRVAMTLKGAAPPVHGVLCFLEADWPLIGGSFTVDGIHVVWPKLLIKRMTEAPSTSVDVESIHDRLASAFPAAEGEQEHHSRGSATTL